MVKPRNNERHHIGRVAIYRHHGAWWIYYRVNGKALRRRIGSAAAAEVEASLVNATIAAGEAGIDVPWGWGALRNAGDANVTITVEQLRHKFLEHHEHVLGSSIATVNRYASATRHLANYVVVVKATIALPIDVADFTQYLRRVEISPNGHRNSFKRRLRDKGVKFILETCRSMYRFGIGQHHLYKDSDNPFSTFGIGKLRVRDAKPIFVFNADQGLRFLTVATAWDFAVFFTLATTPTFALLRGAITSIPRMKTGN